MNIKKSLLALAVMALATMAFASSATAGTGKIKHVTNNTDIPANTELHFVGWAEFAGGSGGYICHVTAVYKATTASTGHITQFNVPDTTKCTGTGGLNGCKLKTHLPTNLPWHVTVTAGGAGVQPDFDVTGNIIIHNTYEGCLVKSATLTFLNGITLAPLKTGVPSAATGTGTGNRASGTAGEGVAIAGVEIVESGSKGVVHTEDIFGGKKEEAVTASGHLELSSATHRCTWKIVKA
jgi:hypothetical protein